MSNLVKRCIARILDENQEVVGAGFLVDRRYVLTCSHVVARACGVDPTSASPPEVPISLDFPLVAPGINFSGTVVGWYSLNERASLKNGSDDIAVLELIEDAPEDCVPAELHRISEPWGDPFRAFGFPAGNDNGVWASGLLRDEQGNGWVQLDGASPLGFAVGPGFSGAPIWNDRLNGIVGMVVATDANAELRAAFMIPCDRLREAWSRLRTSPESSSRILLRPIALEDAVESYLVRKLRRAGASEATVGYAVSLRAAATIRATEFASRMLDSNGTDLLGDVRMRLEIQANAESNRYADQENPAELVWTALLDVIKTRRADFDRYSVFDQDPYLLLGAVCQLSDECRCAWGVQLA
jgi:hypothetical protein